MKKEKDENIIWFLLSTLILPAIFSIIGLKSKNNMYYYIAIIILAISIIIIMKFKKRINRIINKIKYKIFKKVKIHNINGFYGREDIIRQIMLWHRSSNNVKCALITGFGGTGKSTIARNFDKSIDKIVNSIVVGNSDTMPNISKKSKCVIFFDYAFERADEILEFYENALQVNSHISIIVLERNFAEDQFSYNGLEFSKAFNLNDHLINEENLAKTICFNVENDYVKKACSYRPSNVSIPSHKAKAYVDTIINKIDQKYHRPIFAFIIADLYKENNSLSLEDKDTKDRIFIAYWDLMVSTSKCENKLKHWKKKAGFTDAEIDIVDIMFKSLKKYSKLYTLISSLTHFNIHIQMSLDQSFGLVLYEHEILINSPGLIDILNPKINYQNYSSYNLFKWNKLNNIDILRLFFFLDSHEIRKSIVVKESPFDLISAWLLRDFIKSDNDLLSTVISLLLKDYWENIYSAITRSVDEGDHSSILIWFYETMNNWEYDFGETDLPLFERLLNDCMQCIFYSPGENYFYDQFDKFVERAKQDTQKKLIMLKILKEFNSKIMGMENQTRFANFIKLRVLELNPNDLDDKGSKSLKIK